MIKTIILDFDGVVVKSVDIKTKAFKELFKEYTSQLDNILEYHLANNAVSRYIKFKYIYENILNEKYNKDIEARLGNDFSKLVFKKVVECPFVEGVEEFLKTFSKKIPFYLATATPQDEIDRIMTARNLKKYFKKIYGTPPGNKIDFIKEILQNENIKPEEAVYIGDMIKDYNIAKTVGVLFIGRRNKESFDGLNVPQYTNFNGISKWLQNRVIR
jgi:phosphoglycolate phosphatase-like HAD superfamily hydrolase